MNALLRIVIIYSCGQLSPMALAMDITTTGQASLWLSLSEQQQGQLGLRLLSEIAASNSFANAAEIDAQITLDAVTTLNRTTVWNKRSKIQFYRFWARYLLPQFELRVGIQKINFGPAKILRTLNWFDNLQPTDPLQLTSGVKSILGRYFFLNNANLWLWGVTGNDFLNTIETMKPKKNFIQSGGRFQFPLFAGEMAITTHHRKVYALSTSLQHNENRLAVDGNWDIGAGIWFEMNIIELASKQFPTTQKNGVLGIDYTFAIGSGVHAVAEHYMCSEQCEEQQKIQPAAMTAFAFDYGLTLFDSLKTIIQYDWDTAHWLLHNSWQRAYDDWTFNTSISLNNRKIGINLLAAFYF